MKILFIQGLIHVNASVVAIHNQYKESFIPQVSSMDASEVEVVKEGCTTAAVIDMKINNAIAKALYQNDYILNELTHVPVILQPFWLASGFSWNWNKVAPQ